jgi:Ca-activated chloride channel family protein
MRRRVLLLTLGLVVVALGVGTWRIPNFWRTPDQRGDAFLRAKRFTDAAKAYSDPWRIGVAQYRNGDFEAAAKTFARVPGANGSFNQGNAWLMHGKYRAAIASYDHALGYRAGWKEATENKALAVARKAKLEESGENREEEQTGPNPEEEPPDGIVFDQKGEDTKGNPIELTEGNVSDEQLRATWLRRVQTTPGDFLRAKFAYQASQMAASDRKEKAK